MGSTLEADNKTGGVRKGNKRKQKAGDKVSRAPRQRLIKSIERRGKERERREGMGDEKT